MNDPASLIKQTQQERNRLIEVVEGLSDEQANYKIRPDTNQGRSIEEIIARTWKPKETAPPIATPHIGGPLSYWLEYIKTSQLLLDKLEGVLDGLDPETVVFPHFLSGPLDAGQRLQFLRFHIVRHRDQITEMMADANFPA